MKRVVILPLAAFMGGIAVSAVLPAKAQSPADPAARQAPLPKPVAKPTPAKPTAGCSWIGARVIHALIRDDVVAAGDFQKIYQSFGCPAHHLRPVLDCVVKNGTPVPGGQAQERVASCWENPNRT
jgi:hypothetical protein